MQYRRKHLTRVYAQGTRVDQKYNEKNKQEKRKNLKELHR